MCCKLMFFFWFGCGNAKIVPVAPPKTLVDAFYEGFCFKTLLQPCYIFILMKKAPEQ